MRVGSSHQRAEETSRTVEELKARQRNLVWPDALINSRGVDEFLWRGAPDAPLVQRVGAWLFGLAFAAVGIGWLVVAYKKHFIVFGILSVVWLYVGARVFLNGFLRRGTKPAKNKK
jgi:hypothetical protein